MIDIEKECQVRFSDEQEYLGDVKQVNNISPLVSITVTTYQQAEYIKQCLDGIVMQITDFPIEIIIGEDGSTDGTRDICVAYAEKYSDKIRLFLRDRQTSQLYDDNGNFVARFNGVWNRMSARGKYIAWCEGDDYWMDPYKLQKQVDFLESNPDYGLVYTSAIPYVEKKRKFKNKIDGTFKDLKSLFRFNNIATLTTLFRIDLYKEYIKAIKPETRNWLMGDYPMWIWFAKNSKVKYIDDVTAVYRIIPNSASRASSLCKQEKFIQSVLDIRLFYNDLYQIGIEIDFLYDLYNRELFLASFQYCKFRKAVKAYMKVRNKNANDIIILSREIMILIVRKLFILHDH